MSKEKVGVTVQGVWRVSWVNRHGESKYIETNDLHEATEAVKRLERARGNTEITLTSNE